MAESFENSRKVGFSQQRCVNLMGLGFLNVLLRYELLTSKSMHVFEVVFLYFHENRAELFCLPRPRE